MSSYNNGDVHTEYVDPQIYVANNRASFALDASKLAYLPNMRLLNVGCTVATAATAYNRLVGSMSTIRNIRLLDGRTELSALRNPAVYLAFKSQQRTNADNKSTASWLKNSLVGLEIDAVNEKLNHVYPNNVVDLNQPDAAANATKVGYLDLMECFPILGALPCLPTDVFPNLRIEVEFHSQERDQITVSTANVTTSVRPLLAVDCVENPELVRALSRSLKESGARWMEIESDRFNAPANAGAANTKQTISEQSMAFVGKRVERLLMCKTLQDPGLANNAGTVIGYGAVASYALQDQTTQVRLNGKNVFPGFDGISRPNQRLGLISDEYGACSAYPGSNLYNWSNGDLLVLIDGRAGKEYGGALSYDCVRIGAKVADLQIQMTRTADGAAVAAGTIRATNAALNINLYAEVDKALVMGRDGQYRIVYA